MQPAEKKLAQLEQRKKYVTYKVRMFPISDDGKFFFDRNKKYPMRKEEIKNGEFYGEVIADIPIYYPEEFVDEQNVLGLAAENMTVEAGKWNYALRSSRKLAFMISKGRASLYPELEQGKDYDFEIVEKIIHDSESTLWDEIKPLKEEKEGSTTK